MAKAMSPESDRNVEICQKKTAPNVHYDIILYGIKIILSRIIFFVHGNYWNIFIKLDTF